MNIVIPALAAFTIGAPIGAFLAYRHFKGKTRPMPAALAHGAFVATGLACLLIARFTGRLQGIANAALVIFLLVAAGGLYLFYQHLKEQELPSLLVLGHGLGAVVGYLILLISLV